MALPRIVLLTTGGTIATRAASRAAVTGYAFCGHGPEALLNAVPELQDVAAVSAEAFAEIASPDITPEFMLRLAKRVGVLLAQDEIDGVVITHGTDTLEETAWFLHLTVRSSKPIVFTGAMRPGSALGSDGPANVLAAVRVAASVQAAGRGVLVVLNDRIHSARLVTKAHTSAPDAFRGGDIGLLSDGRAVFTGWAEGLHTASSDFDAAVIQTVPRVDLLTLYTGISECFFEAVLSARPNGLVLACTGNGSLPTALQEFIERIDANGTVVVRSSRTLAGVVSWAALPGLLGGVHSPQKARLLLGLALQHSSRTAHIQTCFLRY